MESEKIMDDLLTFTDLIAFVALPLFVILGVLLYATGELHNLSRFIQRKYEAPPIPPNKLNLPVQTNLSECYFLVSKFGIARLNKYLSGLCADQFNMRSASMMLIVPGTEVWKETGEHGYAPDVFYAEGHMYVTGYRFEDRKLYPVRVDFGATPQEQRMHMELLKVTHVEVDTIIDLITNK